jgi:hypothetical protein
MVSFHCNVDGVVHVGMFPAVFLTKFKLSDGPFVSEHFPMEEDEGTAFGVWRG